MKGVQEVFSPALLASQEIAPIVLVTSVVTIVATLYKCCPALSVTGVAVVARPVLVGLWPVIASSFVLETPLNLQVQVKQFKT